MARLVRSELQRWLAEETFGIGESAIVLLSVILNLSWAAANTIAGTAGANPGRAPARIVPAIDNDSAWREATCNFGRAV